VASNGFEGTGGPPLIGVTSYLERARFGIWDTEAVVLSRRYVDAVVAAGGLPVVLPPVGRWSAKQIDRLDGLVLAGGADIDPVRYGQQPHPMTGRAQSERDSGEFALLELALRADLPVLGVCRGMQLLNIALGGTLRQHLPETVGTVAHQPEPGTFGQIDVQIAAESALAATLGESVRVRCHHHQSLERLGTGVIAVGWAEDGTIEAVELAGARFAIGVQWHPEEDSTDRRLFRALVLAAVWRSS
jgi:putative glutamine amidotransferase